MAAPERGERAPRVRQRPDVEDAFEQRVIVVAIECDGRTCRCCTGGSHRAKINR